MHGFVGPLPRSRTRTRTRDLNDDHCTGLPEYFSIAQPSSEMAAVTGSCCSPHFPFQVNVVADGITPPGVDNDPEKFRHQTWIIANASHWRRTVKTYKGLPGPRNGQNHIGRGALQAEATQSFVTKNHASHPIHCLGDPRHWVSSSDGGQDGKQLTRFQCCSSAN
jgi:hypothetical protein